MSTTTQTVIRYPRELADDGNSDYLSFGFYKYYPAYRKKGRSSNRVDNYNQTTGASGNVTTGYQQSFWSKDEATRKAQKLNSPAGNFGAVDGPNILLYMPPDISTSFATDWAGKGTNNVTAGGLAASANIQVGDVKGLMDNLLAGTTSLGALPQSLAARITKAAAEAAGSTLTMNDVMAGTTGAMLNPNVELLFGGPKLRNVSFAFKMSARNEDEAEDIHEICTTFKRNALPLGYDQKKNVAYGNFIEVPNLVMLKYMKGSKMHPYLSQYKSCAITNVDINYTPDGVYSTFTGGHPTAVELRLSLVETKIVYKQEIGEQTGSTGKGYGSGETKGNNENVGRTWSY